MTVFQVAKELNVCPETVRRWVRSGRLSAKERPGEKTEYDISKDDLTIFVKDNPKYLKNYQIDITDDLIIKNLEKRLQKLEVMAEGLKHEYEFIQSEISSLKGAIEALYYEED